MESSELALYRGLGNVRNYGVFVLIALFALNAGALGILNWIETNDIQSELVTLSANLPSPGTEKGEQTINLPDDVIALHVTTKEHTGFYETSSVGKEYLAYANPEKNYVIMKSEQEAKREVQDFAMTLTVLYLGEVILLLGWWLFLRTKVRELFETL